MKDRVAVYLAVLAESRWIPTLHQSIQMRVENDAYRELSADDYRRFKTEWAKLQVETDVAIKQVLKAAEEEAKAKKSKPAAAQGSH